MKRILTLVLAAIAALMLSACNFTGSTKPAPAAFPVTAAAAGPAPFSPAEMIATCAGAIEKVATAAGGDAASKVVAVGAIERMCGPHAAGYMAQVAQAQQARPPERSWGESVWMAALQVADVGLRAWGIKVGADVAIRQSDNQAAQAIASYGAFQTMGGQIAAAGTAGYPYVQAPQANQSWTLSGTGVLGSGSYVGPVTTTTRTCTGGAAGSAVPPAIPGAGGAASC